MLYISSKINGGASYGITDTKDGIEEFYSYSQIAEFYSLGIEIVGVRIYNGVVTIVDVFPNGFGVKYKLDKVNGDILVVKKYIHLVNTYGYSYNIKDTVFKWKDLDITKAKLAGIDIVGLDVYNASIIHKGSRVVFVRKTDSTRKPYLILDGVDTTSCIIKRYYFDSDIDLKKFCDENSLVIVNDFYTAGSEEYRKIINEDYQIDRVIWQENSYISLGYTIVNDFLYTVAWIYSQSDNKEYDDYKYEYCAYNVRENCFNYALHGSPVMFSFKLGTREPDDGILRLRRGDIGLIERGSRSETLLYNWRNDLKRYGVCIVSVNKCMKKNDKDDIIFYSEV